MHDCFVSTLDTIVWLGAHYVFAIATARAATSPFVFNSIDAIVWLDMRYMSATKHCSVSPPLIFDCNNPPLQLSVSEGELNV